MDFGLPLPPDQTIDLDGPVHYRDYDGPPGRTFVLIHGLGGCHLNWWQVAPELARHGRVLVPDLAGFGLTPRAGRRSDLRSNRILLSRFLTAVEARPAVIVGNSMGGSIGLLQAAVEPDSVEGLVLSSGALPHERGVRPALVTQIGFNLYRVPILGNVFTRMRIKGMSAERTTEVGFWLVTADAEGLDPLTWSSQTEIVRRQQADPDAIPAFLQAARSLMVLGAYRRATHEIVERVRCPVLSLHGDEDRLVPIELARINTQRHANWSLVEFPGRGHAIQLEDPKSWVVAVEDWLESPAFA